MKYLRRFLWFLTARMFWVTVVAGLLIVVFYFAMNFANLYILLHDGLEARAGVVLMDRSTSELTKFFRRDFLENDQVLRVGMSDRSPYADYDIRGFEHEISLERLWSWPWENVARGTIVERVPRIDGKIKAGRREAALAAGGEERLLPPAWQAARYIVTMQRTSGQWKIASLQRVEALPDPIVVSASTQAPASP